MKLFRFVTIALFIFLVTGCDDFSLYSQFTRDKETEIVEVPGPDGTTDPLDFTLGATTLTSGNSVEVFIVKGKPPFSLLKTGEDVYLSGAVSIDLGTFTETQYTAGKTCGTIKLTVIDSAGDSVSNIVTVKPRPVEGLTVSKDVNKKNTLTWDYPENNLSYIEKFEIQYSPDDSSYTAIGFVLPTSAEPRLYFENQTRPQMAYYKIIVHAGDLQSQGTTIASP